MRQVARPTSRHGSLARGCRSASVKHLSSKAGRGGDQYRHRVGRTSFPDGYTLLLFDPSAAINATLFDQLNFNFVRDIAPVVLVVGTLSSSRSPIRAAKTLPEFIAYAKAHPGKINMASGGTGSASQLAGELFKVMAGVDMTHIPYRGGGLAVTNLLGGQVDVFFAPVSTVMQYIKADKLQPWL